MYISSMCCCMTSCHVPHVPRPYVLVPNIVLGGERERDQFSRPARASVITQLPGQTRLSGVQG